MRLLSPRQPLTYYSHRSGQGWGHRGEAGGQWHSCTLMIVFETKFKSFCEIIIRRRRRGSAKARSARA